LLGDTNEKARRFAPGFGNLVVMADEGWQSKFEGPIFDHPHLFPKVGDFT
jgi:hypothetical protein